MDESSEEPSQNLYTKTEETVLKYFNCEDFKIFIVFQK